MRRSLAVLALATGVALSACANGEEEADVLEEPGLPPSPAPSPTDTMLTTTTDSIVRTTTTGL